MKTFFFNKTYGLLMLIISVTLHLLQPFFWGLCFYGPFIITMYVSLQTPQQK